LEDNKHGEPWKVVQKFSHRHLWNVPEEENDDLLGQAENELSYQDDEQENTSFFLKEKILVFRLQILRELQSTNSLATMKMVFLFRLP